MFPENEKPELQRNLKKGAIVAGSIFGAILVFGSYTRFVQASDLKTWTDQTDIPTVALVSPVASNKGQSLVLPGTLQAFYDAPIYARVPGYVKAWYKDIGARVKKGELLATIDTPDLDQQISQARADLTSAVAAQKLSATTAARWNALLPLDAVSKQDTEVKDQDLASKEALTKAAQANLDRLLAMKSFAQIVAPFDGVVTKRTIDIGALVNVGSSSSNGQPLFAVSEIDKLRVYVDVPQSYSAQIVPGMNVTLSVPEYPGRKFAAKLVSTSNAISSNSSTLLVEFETANNGELLKPGDYVQVDMGLPSNIASLRLPVSTLMFRAAGMEVATLGSRDHIIMKPIQIATDLGTSVIVSSGLAATDRVVDNPPDSLANGDLVRVSSDHAQ